jgi:dipeptide/tripeptide permease
MEPFERLAYYGMVLVLGIYLVDHIGIRPDVYGVVYAVSTAAVVVALGIFVWSIGEMTCSARFFEYCGTIAPPDQVAVYLGYSFLSLFLANLYAPPWAGLLYQHFVTDRMAAHVPPQFVPFFGSVMLMGALAVVGMTLYGKFVAPTLATHASGEPV